MKYSAVVYGNISTPAEVEIEAENEYEARRLLLKIRDEDTVRVLPLPPHCSEKKKFKPYYIARLVPRGEGEGDDYPIS